MIIQKDPKEISYMSQFDIYQEKFSVKLLDINLMLS